MGLEKRSKKSGGSGCQPGEHLKNILIAHDFIKFFIKSKINIFEAAKPLYENKLTIPEISKKLNIPASTIRDAMKSQGYVFRDEVARQKLKTQKERSKTGGSAPFGYCWLSGELVIESREYKVVLEIVKLRQSGLSLRAIAKVLNNKNIPSRQPSCRWQFGVVNKILSRFKKAKSNGGRP